MTLSNNGSDKGSEKSKAAALLTQYCDAYNNRDENTLKRLFTQDCQLWGTALDEYRTGIKAAIEQHKRDWSQSEQGSIKIVSWLPTPQDALWAAAVCQANITVDGVQYTFEHLRGSLSIVQEDGVWKIAFMHASFPDMRNAPGNSFPLE